MTHSLLNTEIKDEWPDFVQSTKKLARIIG